MTHQEKIEAIRTACIVANPEIVELKFGCQLMAPWGRPVSIWDVIPTGHACQNKYLVEGGHYFYDSHRKGEFLHENSTQDAYKIIGHQVRLADALNAISEKEKYKAFGTKIAANGGFYRDGYIEACWNLRQDDLTLQDERTIDFIHDLLK